MTPQELKASILQMAIQGKLVEQRPDEGTGEELYGQIQSEKQALIKAGKIKKEKARAEITEEEISFDIPESWKWIRLGEIASVNGGFAFKSTNYTTDGVRVIRISDFNESGFVNDSIVRHLYDESLSQYVLDVNNILLCMTGGTVGKSLFVTHIDEMMVVNQRVATIKVETVLPEYVYQVILAPITQKVIQHSKNSTNDNISMDTIKDFLIPLPPLAEQKRIVAKIEELLPLIDRYEKAWSRLEDFNKRFPVDMQKSILQMAIQGKLVEQLPEEGTGEELYRQIQAELKPLILAKRFKGKKLPELSVDELPFEIPSSWKWVRLGDIISIESGKNLTSSQMRNGSVPVYGGNGITGYHDESLVHEETVVIGRVGFYCGSVHVTEKEAWITDNAFITTYPFMSIDRSFLVYTLRHMDLGRDNNATAQPVVSGKKIYPLAFPLPPLAEQKRIVARLEELLPLCERLK